MPKTYDINNYYTEVLMSRLVQYERIVFNKDSIIDDNPHYSDPNFQNKEQTIFGKEEKNLHYVYSDRLCQWDYKKHELATKIADKKGKEKFHTCTYYEIYLSEYYGKPIEIKHIIAGVNRSSGYSYLVFGYIEKENELK